MNPVTEYQEILQTSLRHAEAALEDVQSRMDSYSITVDAAGRLQREINDRYKRNVEYATARLIKTLEIDGGRKPRKQSLSQRISGLFKQIRS